MDSQDGGNGRQPEPVITEVRGFPRDEGDAFNGRHTGRTHGRRAVNKLLQGVVLATTLGSALSSSHVGQLVSSNTSYRDLEGPIFGDRVGIYHSTSEHGPWQKEASQDGEYRMILYKAQNTLDAEIDADVLTLPRKVRKDLAKLLGKA